MNTVLHKADTRGSANHGWLQSKYSFSFGNYYNSERKQFGMLRVLNDDCVEASKGFGKHPHDNIEIISIPLEGDLEHMDSLGNIAVIREGDLQIISAGTGVFHSEYNKHSDRSAKFIQIWIHPNKKNVEPRYDQITLNTNKIKNQFSQVVSPNETDDGVWLYQDAWFHIGQFEEDMNIIYSFKKEENGVYAFILKGTAEIEGQQLLKRDGFGIWGVKKINITTNKNSKILLIEVPMNYY